MPPFDFSILSKSSCYRIDRTFPARYHMFDSNSSLFLYPTHMCCFKAHTIQPPEMNPPPIGEKNMAQVSQIVSQAEPDKMFTNHHPSARHFHSRRKHERHYTRTQNAESAAVCTWKLAERSDCPGFRASVIYMAFIFKPQSLQGEMPHLEDTVQ